MSAATDAFIRKLESIGDVRDDARHAITELPMHVRELERGEEFVRDGEQPSECCLLIAGVMHRYKIVHDGKRQILAFHFPGDIPDLLTLHVREIDHTVAATMQCTVAFVTHDALRRALRFSPVLTDLLWRDTLIDAAIFRQRMVCLGRRDARGHLAHLICEMFSRLHAIGMTDNYSCHLPMTQTDIGDALGLSGVHTNRTLQELRAEGLVEWEHQRVRISDWRRLKEVAEFNPSYLNLRTRID